MATSLVPGFEATCTGISSKTESKRKFDSILSNDLKSVMRLSASSGFSYLANTVYINTGCKLLLISTYVWDIPMEECVS